MIGSIYLRRFHQTIRQPLHKRTHHDQIKGSHKPGNNIYPEGAIQMKVFDKHVAWNQTAAEIHGENKHKCDLAAQKIFFSADGISQHSRAKNTQCRSNNRPGDGNIEGVINRIVLKQIRIINRSKFTRPNKIAAQHSICGLIEGYGQCIDERI
ncbi:hypothetical protein D3C75_914290 [compost metagenome]